MSENKVTVVLVGHCRPDAFAMRSALGRYVPGAEFVEVGDEAALDGHTTNAVFLVNRVLDGAFGDESGLRVVGELAGRRLPVALISNLEDAQTEAVSRGAQAGFGKSEMYSDRARAAMEALVAASEG